jgi:hypothetical protein
LRAQLTEAFADVELLVHRQCLARKQQQAVFVEQIVECVMLGLGEQMPEVEIDLDSERPIFFPPKTSGC